MAKFDQEDIGTRVVLRHEDGVERGDLVGILGDGLVLVLVDLDFIGQHDSGRREVEEELAEVEHA